MEITLTTPIRYVPRIGPMYSEKLEKLGIQTVEDLIVHLPHRYNDFTNVKPIADLSIGDTVTIRGTVQSMKNVRTKTGKFIQQAIILDDSGKVSVTWFNQIYLTRVITEGMTVAVSGIYNWFGKTRTIIPKEYEILSDSQEQGVNTGRLVPVYPETKGVTSKFLRARIQFLLDSLNTGLTDPLPEYIRTKHQFPTKRAALYAVHFPTTLSEAEFARKRLAFEELFITQLMVMKDRKTRESLEKGIPFSPSDQVILEHIKKLPFTLTLSQNQALQEILADLKKPTPMNRLLEGDVGAGKTVVAALAMAFVAKTGYSAVLMAPTQILAEQHYRSIQALLATTNIPIHLITGNTNTKKGIGIF
jgi:ATP-dependent DNA helicase RecG